MSSTVRPAHESAHPYARETLKGAKKLGVRLGNWLTAEQGRSLLQAPSKETLKGSRDRAVLALLLGCGLRRATVSF